jgi:acyl-CoA synthetase (AMP-forming)/AMP-acid ligase II/acyl carrier protein
MQTTYQTLAETITAHSHLTTKGITFISGSDKEVFLSYHHLYRQALCCLGCLQSKGLQPGDELVFQVEDNQTFLVCFWACMLGGFRAVPLGVGYHAENSQKLARVWKTLNQPYLVTSQEIAAKLQLIINNDPEGYAGFTFADCTLYLEELAKHEMEGLVHSSSASDIAFIQFSSGSTGNPKGVVLTHHNLMANIAASIAAYAGNEQDSFLSWMPLTHDMGLIGFHLNPLFLGIQQYIIPTALFVRRPSLWLQKVSEHRASITSSPNFGYKHYLNQFDASTSQHLDLSCVRLIFNGAEPIDAGLCRTFLTMMRPFGLKRGTMFTVYGLAEATLSVAFPVPGKDFSSLHLSRQSLGVGQQVLEETGEQCVEFICEGRPIQHCQIKITDGQNREVAEGTVGLVHIKGASVTGGYYNNEAASQALLLDGWLNTGDLGFIHNGDLYLTGRAKDVIFIRGLNVYGHDLERVAEELDEIDTGKIVACGVPDEETKSEALVLFVLFKGSTEKFYPLSRQVKTLIAKKLALEVKHVLPIRSIPKTTSGKVKRFELAEQFKQGEFNLLIDELALIHQQQSPSLPTASLPVLLPASVNSVQGWLIAWLSVRLDTPSNQIDSQKSFADHGVTSVMAVELAKHLSQALGFEINTTVAWSFPTIHALSVYLTAEANKQSSFSVTAVQSLTSRAAIALDSEPAIDIDSLTESELATLLSSELEKN